MSKRQIATRDHQLADILRVSSNALKGKKGKTQIRLITGAYFRVIYSIVSLSEIRHVYKESRITCHSNKHNLLETPENPV